MIRWDAEPKRRMPMAMLVTYDKYEGFTTRRMFQLYIWRQELTLRRVGKQYHFKVREQAISPDTTSRSFLSSGLMITRVLLGSFSDWTFPSALISHCYSRYLCGPGGCVETGDQDHAAFCAISLRQFPRYYLGCLQFERAHAEPTNELRRGFSSEGHTHHTSYENSWHRVTAKRFRRLLSDLDEKVIYRPS